VLPPSNVRRVLLLNATEPGEIRVAILEDGELTEIFVERLSQRGISGNVYKARIVNVEPSLQAAFVDLGSERNGFLHVSDCLPPDGGMNEVLRFGAHGAPKPDTAHGGHSHASHVPAHAALPAPVAAAVPASIDKIYAPVVVTPDAPPVSEAPSGEQTPAGTPPDIDDNEEDNFGNRIDRNAASIDEEDDPPQPGTPGGPPLPGTPGAPRPGGQNRPHGHRGGGGGGGGGGKRRRRGGRGRSGRGRPPGGPAPMVAPTGDEPNDTTPPNEPESQRPQEPVPQSPAEHPDHSEHADQVPPASNSPAPSAADVTPDLLIPPPEAFGEGLPELTAEDATSTPLTEQTPPTEGQKSGQPSPDRNRERRDSRESGRDSRDSGRHGRADRKFFTVQEMLRRGQEVLVQVVKEGINQKGPALTTYLSIPGRYLVLMPAVRRIGVSKRIDDEQQRREMKEILGTLHVPEGMGVIMRTAGMGHGAEEIQRDFKMLMQQWETLRKRALAARAPTLIYEEGDVITRVFRDILTDDMAEIYVDDPVVYERAKSYLHEASPGTEQRLKHYNGTQPLFHKYGVDAQIQKLFHRKVPLKSGGSIVIEQTEALVAIDVNTGRYREKSNQTDTILATNLEAAREAARQLRLRDIGGLVMIDFIDMDNADHRRQVERELKTHLARDKARINVLPISQLGVVEMTRQRVRHGLRQTMFDRCPSCQGTGSIKNAETLGLELLREIKSFLAANQCTKLKAAVHPGATFLILNRFRRELLKLEESSGVRVEVLPDPDLMMSQWKLFSARENGDWVLRKGSEVDEYVRNH